MITDFQKSIAADFLRLHAQVLAKQAEVRELLRLFRVGFLFTLGLVERAAFATAMGAPALGRELINDAAVAELALASIASQITTLREEVTALRRELAVDVQLFEGSLTS